jgi:hypothetical protein
LGIFFTLVLQPSGHQPKAGVTSESSVETTAVSKMLVYSGRMNFAKHAAIHQQRGEGTDVPCDFKVVPEPRFFIKTAL